RYGNAECGMRNAESSEETSASDRPSCSNVHDGSRDAVERFPTVLLLPGSRVGELTRHVPIMLAAAERIAATGPVRFRMVLPDETLTKQAASIAKNALKAEIAIQTGGLA